jgi:hypothetical protein
MAQSLWRTRRLPAVAEYVGEQAAGGPPRPRLLLQLFDPGLCGVERLFLHDNGLRHVVWRAGLPGDLLADIGLGLRITRRCLTLDIG